MPGAGQYGVYSAGVINAYQQAQAAVQQQRGSFLQGQGLTGQYDANGNYIGFGVDANAPGGAYQQMQQQNAQSGMQSDAALGALGFGGGVAQQHSEATQQGVSQNAANWASNALGNLGGFSQQEQQNTQQEGSQLYSGLLSDITSAIANGTYNPANYSGINIPGYGTVDSSMLPPATAPNTAAPVFSAGGSAGGAGKTGKKKGK
jgi:hypothetical protein